MYDQPAEDIETLFVRLRKGEPGIRESASKQIAQRFDRWFQTIATHRLGQPSYHSAYESACQDFSASVKNITRKKDLIPQAYGIIQTSIKKSNAAFQAGDHSNTMLQQRPPSDLLNLVWKKLSPDEQHLFSLFYINRDRALLEEGSSSIESLAKQVLEIRQKLKYLMKEHANITFTSTNSEVKSDLIPLPLFESGMLANEQEKQSFEMWLLTVPEVCNDLMEFVPFVHCLQDPSTASMFAPEQPVKRPVVKPTAKDKVVEVSKVTEQPVLTPDTPNEPTDKAPVATQESFIPTEIENYANKDNTSDTIKTIVFAVLLAMVILGILWLFNN
jgi:hypothetical protein